MLNGKLHSASGVQFVASMADLDQFERQIEETVSFLGSHLRQIEAAASFPGVQHAVLDFGVCLPAGHVAQFSLLPLRLIRLVAQAGVDVQVSNYLCSDENNFAH